MNHYQLQCREENKAVFTALLQANNMTVDETSKCVLCEDGVQCATDYDFLILFKRDKIAELINLLKGRSGTNPTMIMGKRDETFIPIDIDSVVFFNSYGNDTFANTLAGESYKIKYKLYQLEEEVLSKHFIRINKSEIVHIKHITKIIPMFKGKLILQLEGYKQPVDISRNFLKDFKERIGL